MSSFDKYSAMFNHNSFGLYSAHEVALDGFDDYEEGLEKLMGCDIGETIEDEFGEYWRRVV